MKRLLDLFLSIAGLVFLSPFIFIVAILIKADSSGPVFFRGLRTGQNGRPFFIYKFRTMFEHSKGNDPRITAIDDSRITRVGKFLRRYKIDEWPQLINIIKGDMSLVGPRPEDPFYVAKYSLEQRKILSARPGITSPASFQYRKEESLLKDADWERMYLENIMPHKLAIDLEYMRRQNFFSDLKLIYQTLISIIK